MQLGGRSFHGRHVDPGNVAGCMASAWLTSTVSVFDVLGGMRCLLTFTGRLSHGNKRFEGGWVAKRQSSQQSVEKSPLQVGVRN